MAYAHLFNPANDDALGRGLWCYTPAPHIRRLELAGALLPRLWAEEGDIFLTPDAKGVITPGSGLVPAPWGWSADTVRRLVRAGFAREELPSDKAIEDFRQRSSRTTGLMLREVVERALGTYVSRDFIITDNPCTALAFIDRNCGQTVVKRPWSGSGRGIFFCSSMRRDAIVKAVEGSIAAQGHVTVERLRPNVTLNFAALFMATDEGVTFEGWSVSSVSTTTATWQGNLCLPQPELESMIRQSLHTPSQLDDAVSAITRELPKLLDNDTGARVYTGPLGIDMLAYGDGDLLPVVELNLRRTMGFVARDAWRRHRLRSTLNLSSEPPHPGDITLSSFDNLSYLLRPLI